MRNGLEVKILLSNSQHTLTTLSHNFCGLFFCVYSFIHSGIGLSGLINIIPIPPARHACVGPQADAALLNARGPTSGRGGPVRGALPSHVPSATASRLVREGTRRPVSHPAVLLWTHLRAPDASTYFVFKFKLSNFYTVCSLKPTCTSMQHSCVPNIGYWSKTKQSTRVHPGG